MPCCKGFFILTTFFALTSCLLKCSGHKTKAQQGQPIAIDNRHYITCNPENNANPSVNIREVRLSISTNLQASLEQVQEQISRIQTIITTQTQLAATTTIGIATTFAEKAQENWKKLAGLLGVGGYLWLVWRNWSAQKWITSPLLWSTWHALRTYNYHDAASRKQTQKSLLLEVSQRYLSKDNPLDYLAPLIQFGIVIEQEIERLKHLCTWRKRIDICYANYLLPITGPTIDEITVQLEHAKQVQLLFRTYIAEQNLQVHLSNYADDLYESKRITRRLHWE